MSQNAICRKAALIAVMALRDSVFVDLLTGAVYAFPKANVIPSKTYTRFLDVPVYDSPCLLVERSALAID